jgi:hypothetical protein
VLSGRELSAISVALSVVGVAGALALLATRRVGRVLVAILLFLAGGGVAAGAGQVLLRNQEVTARQWPLLCIVAGLVMASCGFSALARGRRWPVMGAKYDAPSPQTSQTSSMGAGSMETSSMGAGSMGAGQLAEPGAVTDSAVMWNALDRGEDPTGG